MRSVEAVGIPVQVGGGLRTGAHVEECLSLGVRRAVVGTAATGDLAFLRDLSRRHPARIAVGIDAENLEALLLLGRIYGIRKQWDSSERAYRRAIEVSGDDPDEEVFNLAGMLVEAGKPEKAVALLGSRIERDPDICAGLLLSGESPC